MLASAFKTSIGDKTLIALSHVLDPSNNYKKTSAELMVIST